MRDLADPSELQVLSRHDPLDQAKADRFWLHWENAPERAKRLPQYWRFAGYVRSDAATTPEDLSDAQAHFQKGLECNPSAQQRADLDVAIAQVEWLRILTLLDSDVPLDDEQVAGLLFQLAVDAEQLADRCSQLELPVSLRADALVVAANCRLELGHWELARLLLDRGARDDEPQPLAAFALQIGRLTALEILDIDDPRQPPSDAFGDLPTVAELALERANRVLLLANQRRAVDPFDVDAAKAAIVLCAAYLGRARDGLPASLTWRSTDMPINSAVDAVAERMRHSGGVLLNHLKVDDDSRLNLLLDATAVIAQELRNGNYTQAEVDGIMSIWREHPTVAPLLKRQAWQALVAKMAHLSSK